MAEHEVEEEGKAARTTISWLLLAEPTDRQGQKCCVISRGICLAAST